MKIKKDILLLFFLLSHIACNGQNVDLRRKASLGIAMSVVNDSIANTNQMEHVIGVYIMQVIPESTADQMGLETSDIITKINKYTIHSFQDIRSSIQNLRADDPIEITYYRHGKLRTTKGKAIARPKETSEFGTVIYEQVQYKGNNLRSILHLPNNVKNPPVVFYIQGYTCQSIEFSMVPNFTTKRLIDDWVKAGFAVFRVEKPNIGDSKCDKGCFEMNFNEEIETFRQGYMQLKSDTRIDADQIFVFGHSIGGIIAPVLAAEFQPKGVITYGTVVNSWFEYMQELTRVQGEMFNRPDVEIERDIRVATPLWYGLFIEKKTPEEILQNSEIKAMLQQEGTLESFRNGMFINRHYSYWSTIQDLKLVTEWSKVQSSVLALYGEFDVQALNSNHIYQIERIVNTKNSGKAQAKIIKGADHGFVRFSTMEENIQALNSNNYPKYLRENYHEGIASETIKWMQQIVN